MRIPRATYRLQITESFTLDDARGIVRYLARLGISDLYLSPIFEARSGSTHGYDVTDPTRVRAAVGGETALRALAAEARAHQMGIILDIVPNHMAASPENPWWRDVLQHGRNSQFASYFDIDWGSSDEPRRLALPILGDEVAPLLERGEIGVDPDAGVVTYHETHLPLAAALTDADRVALADSERRLDALRRILQSQHYELQFWRTASERVSYRRFFDITDLVGVRVEDDAVFRATHELVQSLAAEGTITGLRIDHVDGLRDPAGYLEQLRAHVRSPEGEPLYTVVEKILERSERLPEDWPCEGTTGYEFMNMATAALIEPDGHKRLEQLHTRITGDRRTFDEVVHEKKLLVLDRLFKGELTALATRLAELTGMPETDARRGIAALTASMSVYRTYTRGESVRTRDRLRIEEAAAAAVARSRDDEETITAVKRVVLLEDDSNADARLDWVMRWQQFTGPVTAKGFEDTALYCHNALLAANDVGSDPAEPWLPLVELHGLLAARQGLEPHALSATATHDTKRGEDTRARVAVLSEQADEWRRQLRRWRREGDEWKAELTEEEDTAAPSADVDSLLYQTLLGAYPLRRADEQFRERIKEYMTKAVREAKEQTSWRRPDEDFEQALHAFIDRIMAAFGREGLSEDVAEFAQRIAPYGALNSLTQLLLKVTAPGVPDFYQGTELWAYTLVDPDNRRPVDYSVRTELLNELLPLRDTPDPQKLRALLDSWQDGRIKLLLTALALRFRARHRDTFEHGAYIPLAAAGRRRDHVIAFARGTDTHACITVLPRWTSALGGNSPLLADPRVWRNTRVPLPEPLRRGWHNMLTGETFEAGDALELRDLFRGIPFALLEPSQPIGA